MDEKNRKEWESFIASVRAKCPTLPDLPPEAWPFLEAGDFRGVFLAWADAGNISPDGWEILFDYLTVPFFNEDLRSQLRGGCGDG